MSSRMSHTLRSTLLGCSALALTTPALAQESAQTTFTLGDTDTVIVTANRILTSVDLIASDVAQDANVDYGWELVSKLPGILITEFNQGATSGKLSFRGFNGEGEVNAVKLLIDGIPSNSNDGNMPYIDMVFPLEINSVEVVRGTTDPRYGLHVRRQQPSDRLRSFTNGGILDHRSPKRHAKMRQNSGPQSAEKHVKEIRRRTRRKFSAEEKIRIVLAGLRGEASIAELCRREGIAEGLYYSWSKEFLEAGKRRLAGDTAREASSGEVKDLRHEMGALKEAVADLTLENRLLKKSMIADGDDPE